MKFIKSNFAKKLIIILIALMIFNIAVPKQVKAWDPMGVLAKGGYAVAMGIVASVDVLLGLLINGTSARMNIVSAICDILVENEGAALENANAAIQQIFIGPDTIFCGNIAMLNANIFDALYENNPKCLCNDYKGKEFCKAKSHWTSDEEDAEWIESKCDCYNSYCPQHKDGWFVEGINKFDAFKDKLQNKFTVGGNLVTNTAEAVAKLYVTLRNICGLIMLAGLLFTGIRILLSANVPTKKTQYLMLLQDWLIGMGLLIFSHVIMILIFKISDALTTILSMRLNGFGGMNFNLFTRCLKSFSSSEQLMCIIMLIYLICLTFVFMFAYFKRFFWICILTVFAPVFAIMYAFGQQTKQIYSQWLKEYMLTVFVQPFHVVVYAVLVGIPLGIGGGKGFNLYGGGLLEIVYCLIAMSFIRPAEKWMRGMFGMNKGIANMASYDSGKQTFDAIKNTIEDVAKKAIQIGGAVVTGGASTALMGGSGDILSKFKGVSDIVEGIGEGEKSETNGETVGEGESSGTTGETIGEGESGGTTGETIGEGESSGTTGETIGEGESGGTTGEVISEAVENFIDNKSGDEEKDKNTDPLKALNDPNDQPVVETNGVEDPVTPEELAQMGKVIGDSVAKKDEDNNDNNKGEKIDKLNQEWKGLNTEQGKLTREIKKLEEQSKVLEQKAFGSEEDMKYNTHFENGMEGEEEQDSAYAQYRSTQKQLEEKKAQRDSIIGRKKEVKDEIAELGESSTSPREQAIGEKTKSSTADQGNQISSNGTSAVDDIKSRVQKELQGISIGNISINADSVNMQGGGNVKFATQEPVKAVEETPKAQKEIASQNNQTSNNQSQANQTSNSHDIELEDTITLKDGLDIFKKLGGIGQIASAGNELYKGLHSITDTLYVDGQSPTDWKGTTGRTDEWIKGLDGKRKERVDREKDNWAHNKTNISIMAEKYYKEKYLPEMQAKYGGSKDAGYIESVAREKAEEKAKSALKDMSSYVPYGITDVNLAYDLYKHANAHGYSPEEAIRSKAGFEKFNNNVQNVAQINMSNSFERKDYSSVQEAIPDANIYYNAGYRDVNDMAWVAKIADALGKTPEFAIQVDQTLRKKGGKINYKGTDKNMKDIINQINANYGG